ncbi:MAG: hypothetical protein QME45_07775 [Clostridiales bacterium]|nr:hypothetical protein [Clostridiales bacterium]HBM81113.1 hypothetical protein [Clostridiaceae bacterium]
MDEGQFYKKNMDKWYAAFVETGNEDNVKARLEYRFQDRLIFYIPKRKLRERKGCHSWAKSQFMISKA